MSETWSGQPADVEDLQKHEEELPLLRTTAEEVLGKVMGK